MRPIEEDVRILTMAAQRARFFRDVAYGLQAQVHDPARTLALERFPLTLGKMYFAHRNSCVLELVWLLHPKESNTLSIRRSLKRARLDGLLEAETFNRLLVHMNGFGPKVQSLRKLRNAVVAHRDLTLSYNEAWRSAALSYDDLAELCDVALTIANSLASAVGVPELCDTSDLMENEFSELYAALVRGAPTD